MNPTIPLLHLPDFLTPSQPQQLIFADALKVALRDVGFFALTGHGLSDALIDEAYDLMKALFQLPLPQKQAYEKPDWHGQRGYVSFGKEHAKDSSTPDLKEFWHVGSDHARDDVYENIWPKELPQFKPVMTELFQSLEATGLKLLEACALALGESAEEFVGLGTGGNSILRLIHYPPLQKDRPKQSLRAAAHEDINLITLLIAASSEGLEIKDRQGDWQPVRTPEGAIIVDAGDMLQNLTNGYFKSTTHRVVNPKDESKERFSLPFFMHAHSKGRLDPLKSCIEKTGGVKYPKISAGDYLNERLREIGLTAP